MVQTSVPGLQRQSFKKQKPSRKRGLSAFYSSKSQSFDCIRDLQANPFCQSAGVVLAKPAWHQTFGSIQEELCDLQHSSSAHELHAGGTMSEPGSPCAHQGLARLSWPGSAAEEEELGPLAAAGWLGHSLTAPELQELGLACGSPNPAGSRCDSLGPCLSSSDSGVSSMDGAAFDTEPCCTQQQPTDSLCAALQAASLAAQQGMHPGMLLPAASFDGL